MSLILVTILLNAQNVNIPDANFKAYLVGNTAINTNLDTEIQVSEASAFTGTIDCQNLGITDLTGIESFTSLTELICRFNNLGALNVSQNVGLITLSSSLCGLTSLDVTQNTVLETLVVTNNNLIAIDLTQNSHLKVFGGGGNSFTSLDVTQNQNLERFECWDNSLSSIDVTHNPLLSYLRCAYNSLSVIDLSQNVLINNLSCEFNSLTSLSVGHITALAQLVCNNNQLSSLDLSQNSNLINLVASDNQLSCLNVKNGNNINVNTFNASNNIGLSCIEVDNVAYSTSNWTNVDAGTSFSTFCNNACSSCSSIYVLGNVSPTCSNTTFCVPLQASTPITSGLLGVDFTLDYDPAIMTPTGNVTLGPVATTFGAYGINTATSGKVFVTVYLNGAPSGTFLNGSGDIACVEFTVNAGITAGTTSTISVDGSVLEGIAGNPTCPATPSTFTLEDDNMLSGFVRYRNKNGRPLLYDASNPSTYVITDITGVDGSCASPSTSIAPDLGGNFIYDVTNGTSLQLKRDIIGDYSIPTINCANVMAVINTTDRNQTLDIVTLTNATPTVYQLLSADVNLDGLVSSQDVSMITSRTINGDYCEFNQGNYVWDAMSGSYIPSGTYTKSKDWLFIDETTLNSVAFTAGMNKNNVPTVPDCLPVNLLNTGSCNQIVPENYEAILLGDVNGNWNTLNAADAKTTEPFTLVFDINNAVVNGNGNYEIPISYVANTGTTAVEGIDFSMNFDEANVNVINTWVDASLPTMLNQWKNHSNALLMFTAFDNNTISTTGVVAYVELQSFNTTIYKEDLGEIIAYINGEPAGVEIRGADIATEIGSLTPLTDLKVYPNPNKHGETLFVKTNQNTLVQQVIITSIAGQEILNTKFNTTENTIKLPLNNIGKGVYFVTVVTKRNRDVVKLIIQ